MLTLPAIQRYAMSLPTSRAISRALPTACVNAYSHSVSSIRGLLSERPALPSTASHPLVKAARSIFPSTSQITRAECDGSSASSGNSNTSFPCARCGSSIRGLPPLAVALPLLSAPGESSNSRSVVSMHTMNHIQICLSIPSSTLSRK